MLEDRICAAWPTADDMALETVAARWNVCYRLGYDGSAYYADRADGAPRLIADSLAGLESLIRADWSRWCDLGAEYVRDA